VVLSKRERFIGIAAGAVIALLVLDRIIISPLLEQRTLLGAQIKVAEGDLKRDNDLIELSGRANNNWAALAPNVRKDASEAERQVLNNVNDWAAEAGINLASVSPQRSERDKDFIKLTYRATGTGQMGQIGRFLYKIQNASSPARVTDLSISTRRQEGTDDLSVSVAVTTICQAPATPSAGEALR
jgi:hypothetical protein